MEVDAETALYAGAAFICSFMSVDVIGTMIPLRKASGESWWGYYGRIWVFPLCVIGPTASLWIVTFGARPAGVDIGIPEAAVTTAWIALFWQVAVHERRTLDRGGR